MESKNYFSLDAFCFLYTDKDDINAKFLQSMIEGAVGCNGFTDKYNMERLKEKNIIAPELFGGQILIETKMSQKDIVKKIEQKFMELVEEIENGI